MSIAVPPWSRPPPGEVGALDRATVRQRPGSMLRVVNFHGGEIIYDDPDLLVLSMGLTTRFRLDYAVARTRADVLPMIGRFGLMTPGQQFRVGLTGDCTVIQLVLPRRIFARWLSEDHEIDGASAEIGWGHSLEDAAIGRLMCTARSAESEDEGILLRRLATRLYSRFATNARHVTPVLGGLPQHKLRRVVEYVEGNLRSAITVDELARQTALSPFHFAHQFERETGRSPYRFVVERRLSRAVELLRDEKLSIETIAARCGFSHTSHLSRHLQRATGRSPTQLRHAMLV